jgi:hypothetical protein
MLTKYQLCWGLYCQGLPLIAMRQATQSTWGKIQRKTEEHVSGVIYLHNRVYFVSSKVLTLCKVHKNHTGSNQPPILHVSCLILSIGLFLYEG